MIDKNIIIDILNKHNVLNNINSKENILNAIYEILSENNKVSEQHLLIAKDWLLHMQADYENLKRRSENEKKETMGNTNEILLKKLLPIYDNYERLLKSLENEQITIEDLDNGIRSLFKLFQNFLSDYGVSEIDVLGKPFDVNYCDAVLAVPSENGETNKVIKVVEKGYMINDKVLRHAKVVVTK